MVQDSDDIEELKGDIAKLEEPKEEQPSVSVSEIETQEDFEDKMDAALEFDSDDGEEFEEIDF